MTDADLDAAYREMSRIARATNEDFDRGIAAAYRDERLARNERTARAKGITR